MKLSLCITTYNRYELTIESFAKVIDDPRIDDIVILDDCSEPETRTKLMNYLCYLNNNNNPSAGKISLCFQDHNVGMSKNKRDAIALARNEWVIIFDSDNVIDPTYLDAFYNYIRKPISGDITILGESTIFCPDFAKPKFDYTVYSQSGMPAFSRFNAGKFIVNDDFNCLMNTCNYIVNRDFYLKTYKHNQQHKASDTIWHNYNHLLAGGNFHVVPGMQYFHRIHNGSGFMDGVEENMANAAQVRRLIQQL